MNALEAVMSKRVEATQRNWYLIRADIGVPHPTIKFMDDSEWKAHRVSTPALAAIRPIIPVLTLSGTSKLRDYMQVGNLMLVTPRLKELFEDVDPSGFDFMKVDATFGGHGVVDYWFVEPTRVLDVVDEDASDVQPIMYEGTSDRQYHGQMKTIVVRPEIDASVHAFRLRYSMSKVLFDQRLYDRIKDGDFTGLDMRISTNIYDH